MMGITHVWVGTMAAVLMTKPATPKDCFAALIGGSLGGIICDIDIGTRGRLTDTNRARKIAGAMTLTCLLADAYFGGGLMAGIRGTSRGRLSAGLIGLLLLCLWGRKQPHRGGVHSLLALLLFSGCVELLCSALARPFMIAMASHLVLDVLNCGSVRLLYPLQMRWSLGLCRTGGYADRCLRMIGVAGTLLGIGIAIGHFR